MITRRAGARHDLGRRQQRGSERRPHQGPAARTAAPDQRSRCRPERRRGRRRRSPGCAATSTSSASTCSGPRPKSPAWSRCSRPAAITAQRMEGARGQVSAAQSQITSLNGQISAEQNRARAARSGGAGLETPDSDRQGRTAARARPGRRAGVADQQRRRAGHRDPQERRRHRRPERRRRHARGRHRHRPGDRLRQRRRRQADQDRDADRGLADRGQARGIRLHAGQRLGARRLRRQRRLRHVADAQRGDHQEADRPGHGGRGARRAQAEVGDAERLRVVHLRAARPSRSAAAPSSRSTSWSTARRRSRW